MFLVAILQKLILSFQFNFSKDRKVLCLSEDKFDFFKKSDTQFQ